MNKSLVSVVITTRDRMNDVIKCISSLFLSTYPEHEIILVDNASNDNTVKEIKSRFSAVQVVKNTKNAGIAGGRNAGMKLAKGEYILFLDSDTIVDKDMIKEMVGAMKEDSKTGIIVPKIYFLEQPDLIWYAGATINLVTSQTKNIGVGEIDSGQYDRISETSHGPTAFLCRREVVDKIGGHDEGYFMSYADMDFAVRAKKSGFKVLYVPSAKLWHKISVGKNKNAIRDLLGTFPFRAYYFARNRIVFMKKQTSLGKFLIFSIFFSPLFMFVYITKIISYKEWRYLKMYLRGIKDGIYYVLTGKIEDINSKG